MLACVRSRVSASAILSGDVPREYRRQRVRVVPVEEVLGSPFRCECASAFRPHFAEPGRPESPVSDVERDAPRSKFALLPHVVGAIVSLASVLYGIGCFFARGKSVLIDRGMQTVAHLVRSGAVQAGALVPEASPTVFS